MQPYILKTIEHLHEQRKMFVVNSEYYNQNTDTINFLIKEFSPCNEAKQYLKKFNAEK